MVDRKQLHQVAEHYRHLKRYKAKLSRWGYSLGVRIPKELVQRYRLTEDNTVTIVPEKGGMKIVAK